MVGGCPQRRLVLQFAAALHRPQCEVDTSTVTRAYQVLKRLGLIRRTDPGRDAANPFEQATCITEVLLPPRCRRNCRPLRIARRDGPARAERLRQRFR